MIDEVYEAFLEEYQIQSCLGFNNNEIDGSSGFIFSTGEGNILRNQLIVQSTESLRLIIA